MRATRVLRSVLLLGAASPVLLMVGLLWAGATRDGYDQLRHGVSQLTSGDAFVAGRDARRRGRSRWAAVCLAVAWFVAGFALAAGVVFRLVQRDVIGTGPAGLLELLSMACGLCWVSVAMLRDRPSWAYADAR